MQTRFPFLMRVAFAAAMVAAVPVQGQTPTPTRESAQERELAAATTPVKAAQSPLLPEVNVEGLPLAEVLSFLRDVDPTFQVVLAGPGAQGGGPIIHELKLKNVSAESVLEVLAQTYPQIKLDRVAADDPESPPIWTVVVGERAFVSVGSDQAMEMMPGPAAERAAQPVTIVRRLRESIAHLAADESDESRAKARSAVLSLIQATIETQGGDGTAPATIKLHEPTETLVFKGTAVQAQFVDEALDTLLPSKNEQIEAMTQKMHETQLQAQIEIQRLRDQVKRQEAADVGESSTKSVR